VPEQADLIPVFQPHIGVDTLKAITDALHVGWLGMGATTRAFEEAIGTWLDVGDRHVLATNTGTSAIHLALLLAGVGPGDEVIVPSFNYVADHQAIVAAGATPVFCDIVEENLGIDPEAAGRLVTGRTKAILPLHFGGIPSHVRAVYDLAREQGLRVVEDATHAFGSLYEGQMIGSFGDLTCFSFDPVKVVTSIDGGAVIMPPEGDLDLGHRLRLLGVDKDTELRYQNNRAWDYDVVSQGFRYHLTNINASVGLSQLRRAGEFIANRQRCCRRYNELLTGLPGIVMPATNFEGVSPFIYTVRVIDGARDALITSLREAGIATGIHFLPAHEYTYFRDCPRGDMTVTEQVGREILTLPLHSGMTIETVERVADAIGRFFN
jgi:dTDP-4-amino-4,6-dideoxygalactose transaminase